MFVVKDDNPPSPSHCPPHSQRSSIVLGKSQDIFIPPDDNWVNPNHPPISFQPQS